MIYQYLNFESLVALCTLTFLEIVLGIDNIIMIAIFTGRLPKHRQDTARKLGLMGALCTRTMLLLALSALIHLTTPFMTILDKGFAIKDLVLIIGGLFLIAKSTHEIYEAVEHNDEELDEAKQLSRASSKTFVLVIIQIALVDIIFSLDSVITAVGMARQVPIMVAAITIAIGIMYFFSKWISIYVNENPSIKILALSFLVLVGVLLLAEGFGEHINKGYVYFAMAFSFTIELVNKRYHIKRARIRSHAPSQGTQHHHHTA